MADQIVRCPYCVGGDHFYPMLEKLKDWFICTRRGHTASLGIANYRCHCRKCQEMNLAA